MKGNKNRAGKQVLITCSGAPAKTRTEGALPNTWRQLSILKPLSYRRFYYSLLTSRTNLFLYHTVRVPVARVAHHKVLELSIRCMFSCKKLCSMFRFFTLVRQCICTDLYRYSLCSVCLCLAWLETTYFSFFVLLKISGAMIMFNTFSTIVSNKRLSVIL